MRLLDTRASTPQLRELLDAVAADEGYAILSHVWQNPHEVEFEDLSYQTQQKSQGWSKLMKFCSLAKSMGLTNAWIDTCCIHKGNSTELSEALNSMYRWYKNSKICIVYLSDVSCIDDMPHSRWFKRGWTLQELIAPETIRFYDRNWDYLGDKKGLLDLLSSITRIPKEILNHEKLPQACSIAQRMSWAARRKTTRIEDKAYSLLGLFDVSLPMLYGEGQKAFIKLQEEIVRTSNDQTIFAWTMAVDESCCGIFANSPQAFKDSQDLISVPNNTESRITNIGFSIEVETVRYGLRLYLAILNATDTSDANANDIGILLASLPTQSQFARVKNSTGKSLFHISRAINSSTRLLKQIYIRQQPQERPRTVFPGFVLDRHNKRDFPGPKLDTISCLQTHNEDLLVMPEGKVGTAGVLRFSRGESWLYRAGRVWVTLGFDEDFEPFCRIGNATTYIDNELFEAGLVSRNNGLSHELDLGVFHSGWRWTLTSTLSTALLTSLSLTAPRLFGDKGVYESYILNSQIVVKLGPMPEVYKSGNEIWDDAWMVEFKPF